MSLPTRPGAVQPFAAALLPLCPEPVRAASEAFREALLRRSTLAADLATAKATLEQVSAADEAAARKAVSDGKSPPSGSTAKAADALDRAARAVAAAAQLEVQEQAAFLAVVAEHFDELTANVAARQEAIRADAENALAILAAGLREKLVLDDLARELHLGSIRARRPMFQPRVRQPRKDPTDPILAPLREVVAGQGAVKPSA